MRQLHASDSLNEVLNQFDDAVNSVMPVVDEKDRLIGVVDLEEVYLVSHAPALQPLVIAADLMRTEVTPLVAEDTLERAYELFVENELSALPLVNSRQDKQVRGLVRRADVASAYLRLLYGRPARANVPEGTHRS